MLSHSSHRPERMFFLRDASVRHEGRGEIHHIIKPLLQVDEKRYQSDRIEESTGADKSSLLANNTDVRTDRRHRIDHGGQQFGMGLSVC